jgi:hypothetical protein
MPFMPKKLIEPVGVVDEVDISTLTSKMNGMFKCLEKDWHCYLVTGETDHRIWNGLLDELENALKRGAFIFHLIGPIVRVNCKPTPYISLVEKYPENYKLYPSNLRETIHGCLIDSHNDISPYTLLLQELYRGLINLDNEGNAPSEKRKICFYTTSKKDYLFYICNFLVKFRLATQDITECGEYIEINDNVLVAFEKELTELGNSAERLTYNELRVILRKFLKESKLNFEHKIQRLPTDLFKNATLPPNITPLTRRNCN